MHQRYVRQVFKPGAFNHRPNHANRMLIPPGNWEAADPFLVLVEDQFHAPSGFPDHPHRGIETVTLVLDGHLRHADNRGNAGVLAHDDVQWMTAGGGISHAELPWQKYEAHTLQLWLNLPSAQKMVPSGYQDLPAAERTVLNDDGIDVRVISGGFENAMATTQNIVPVQYLDVTARAGKTATLPVPASHNGFVHVVEGSVLIGAERTPAGAGDVAWLDYPEVESGVASLTVEAQTDARFLVVTGQPVREPVVAYGPFVMCTTDEIRQAYADYEAGRFGGPTPAALEVRGTSTQ